MAVNFDTIETSPVYDPVSHLVYCCDREQVSDVWIAGKQLMKNRTLTTLDIKQIKFEAQELATKIKN